MLYSDDRKFIWGSDIYMETWKKSEYWVVKKENMMGIHIHLFIHLFIYSFSK